MHGIARESKHYRHNRGSGFHATGLVHQVVYFLGYWVGSNAIRDGSRFSGYSRRINRTGPAPKMNGESLLGNILGQRVECANF
jgi:hypothetical protein